MGDTHDTALVRDKERRAVALKLAGVTYQVIAEQVGYHDGSGARKAVMRALDRDINTDVEEIRKQELGRLDELIIGLWPKARSGNVRSVEGIIRLMERRAKYLGGLDVPTEINVKNETVTRDEFADFMAGAAAAFAVRDKDDEELNVNVDAQQEQPVTPVGIALHESQGLN